MLFRILETLIRIGWKLMHRIDQLERHIMATMAELQASLDTIGDQLAKASAEIVAEIQTLKDELAAGGITTPGVDASVARLTGFAQALDDLNPDQPKAP
jgi:hypothetical protein